MGSELAAVRSELIRLGALPTSTNEPPLLVADVRRLHEEVGWKAHHNLHMGLQEELNWWMTQRERRNSENSV